MPDNDIDLLAINRGTVTAPAGCGKTHLIAEALTRHGGSKPILVLTHTNAGVVALRGRLDRLACLPKPIAFRQSTAGPCGSSRHFRRGVRTTPTCCN